MELKDFIGKVVVSTNTKTRYLVKEVNASYFKVLTEEVNKYGTRACYMWECVNGDPISNGYLQFEDSSLSEPFISAYNKHCNSKEGYWEDYGYWMRKD